MFMRERKHFKPRLGLCYSQPVVYFLATEKDLSGGTFVFGLKKLTSS